MERFSMTIEEVTPLGKNSVFYGDIISGNVSVGDSVRIVQSGDEMITTIGAIVLNNQEIDSAHEGQSVSLLLRDVLRSDVRMGSWISDIVVTPSFSMVVDDKYAIESLGTALIGKISLGLVKTGDEINIINPEGLKSGIVVGIEKNGTKVEEATEGEIVGILVGGLNKNSIPNHLWLIKF